MTESEIRAALERHWSCVQTLVDRGQQMPLREGPPHGWRYSNRLPAQSNFSTEPTRICQTRAEWLFFGVNSKVNGNVSLFGSYVLNYARSNTDGLSTFPANPYSMAGEYGPALTDIRNRVSFGGTIKTKWNLQLNPLLTLLSGQPFDITVGQDVYGDTLFNGRPGIATDPYKPGVIQTTYGLLDPSPTPGEQILPRNYGRGPVIIMLNLRVGRTFSFGPPREASTAASGGGGTPRGVTTGPFSTGGGGQSSGSGTRRYSISISTAARNILNHNNPGPIIGNIASPLFGQANQPLEWAYSAVPDSQNQQTIVGWNCRPGLPFRMIGVRQAALGGDLVTRALHRSMGSISETASKLKIERELQLRPARASISWSPETP